MKKIIIAVLGVIVLSPVFAQQKVVNDPNAEVRTAKNFHAIKVSTGIRLYLTQGNEEAVAVSASKPEYREKIVTSVENGVLKIYYDNGKWGFHNDNDKDLKAYVSCKMLDALGASSGAHISVDGTIKSGNLVLDFSSGAEFKGEISVTDLKVGESSGSVSTISGTTGNLTVEASSGSAINAFDLRSDACEARASSGASVDVNVNKSLTASAHSGGQINYKGSGVISSVNTSSGGSVSKR